MKPRPYSDAFSLQHAKYVQASLVRCLLNPSERIQWRKSD